MKYVFAILVIALCLYSCTDDQRKQFEHAGGTLTMALDEEPSTYLPRQVMDYYSATVLSQITEGLVGLDPKSTEIIPKLATSWEKSDDGKVYQFTLRENVYFHPHKVFNSKEDRILVAKDVQKSFELGCKKEKDGSASALYSCLLYTSPSPRD